MRAILSTTAYQSGKPGSGTHRHVCGLTRAERVAVKDGTPVVFYCGTVSNTLVHGFQTGYRVAVYDPRGYIYPRVYGYEDVIKAATGNPDSNRRNIDDLLHTFI